MNGPVVGAGVSWHRLGAKDIYKCLRDQIATGVYDSGQAIPSSRALSRELGVSRTTVNVAYEQLAAEGYITVQQGARAVVAVSFPTQTIGMAESEQARDPAARLSRYGMALANLGHLPQPSPERLLVNFRYGEVASQDFPSAIWRRAVTVALSKRSDVLAYEVPQGSLALRRALQAYLWRTRSIDCTTEQIFIVSGSQQGLDILSRILLDPESSFIIENPSYAMARLAFATLGATAIPIEVDSLGMMTQDIGDREARLAYVTPSHQYPLGGVLAMERRLELLAWSQMHDAWIIEDDYDSEYRYDVKPLPPLKATDENNRVIYVGTVSKTLSPALRIGYVVLPDMLVGVFEAAKQLADRHTSMLQQEALAELIENGAYERHIRKQRRLNQKRRQILIDALEAEFGSAVKIEGAEAGLHLVVWFNDLPASLEGDLIKGAREHGVGIYSVRPLCDPPLSRGRNEQIGLVMGYASMDEESIPKGVRLLRKAYDKLKE